MVEPYLNLSGKSSEAIDFYERVFHGQAKQVMYFKDAPQNPDFPVPNEIKDYVLHAEMIICGTKFNFSDTQEDVVPGNMISLAVRLATADKVTSVFDQLKEGGEVLMELAPQFYSPMYGWVKDKYGVGWQLICEWDYLQKYGTNTKTAEENRQFLFILSSKR